MTKTIKVIGCAVGLGLLFPMLVLMPRLLRSDSKQNGVHELFKVAASQQQKNATNLNSARRQLLRLHRQKRYLTFPEGSSFQMVFDLIIPIVDYTNFAIMGVTCAVAWELPSKMPSELIENVRTRLNDGTLDVVRRNGSVGIGATVATDAPIWQALHAQPNRQTKEQTQPQPPAYVSHYYSNVPHGAATSGYANTNGQRQPATNWHARRPVEQLGQWSANNNWWQRNKARVEQNWRQKQRLWSAYERPQRYNYVRRQRKLLETPPRHSIYPVFGKRRRRRRSLDIDADFELVHLRAHLSTRELLFRKIERLYKSQQLNGTACVLRALCESAQRQDEAQPQSFIMELLSAIFQLPTDNDANDTAKHISEHYLAAHQQRGNCRQLYSDCSHGFWLD